MSNLIEEYKKLIQTNEISIGTLSSLFSKYINNIKDIDKEINKLNLSNLSTEHKNKLNTILKYMKDNKYNEIGQEDKGIVGSNKDKNNEGIIPKDSTLIQKLIEIYIPKIKNDYWHIGGINTNKSSKGNGIKDISFDLELPKGDKQYKINMTDGTSSTFIIPIGKDGKGITDIEVVEGNTVKVFFGGNKEKIIQIPTIAGCVVSPTEPKNKNIVWIEDNGQPDEVLKDGKSLEFIWRGTELGIKKEGDTIYNYVDLEVDSSSYLKNNQSQTLKGSLTVEGEIYATNEITAFSDRQLKSNIQIIPNALDKIMSINGYTFEMRGEEHSGVIAQEIQKVLPQVVRKGKLNNKEYLTVAYGNMMGLLIQAIKEQQEEIVKLKERVDKYGNQR